MNIKDIMSDNIIVIILIIIIVCLLKDNVKNHFEGLININNINKITVRKLDDYYTPKQNNIINVINIKCKIDDNYYFIANVPKSKFNKYCPICDNTKNEKNMLVLVNEKKVISNECYEEELIKCYNKDDISDCNNYALKKCNPNEVFSSCLDMILDNIDNVQIKDGNINIPSYVLKTNNLSIPTMATVFTINGLIDENKKMYLLCLNTNVGLIMENQKIYLDTENLSNDRIKFRMYFYINMKKLYLGACTNQICQNIVCETEECENDFKFICLYDDRNHKNVLIFEPILKKKIRI